MAARSLLRVTADDAEYRRLAAAEMDFWSKPHPFGLEALEKVESAGPAERYNNERLTGQPGVPWYEMIPRYGQVFRRGLVLGTSAMRVEARILETNPSLHLTFLDISPGAVARRAEVLGARFPGRVGTAVSDLNFVALEPESYDLIVTSATLHHVTNLEYVADQINRALTGEGRFFLQDYVGEPRFQFSEEKRRVFTLLHDRELAATQPWRKASIVFDDASDLSPFCGVRSHEVLSVLGTYLDPVEVRTAGALLVALMRAHPTDLASIGTRSNAAWRAAFWLERRAYGLVGRLPPRNTLMPDRFLRTLGEMGDLLADAGLLVPGTAFGVYRKR
ncbi:MAG: class I SAM-dependent methyltransferase [Candidatus Binatia bacterium]